MQEVVAPLLSELQQSDAEAQALIEKLGTQLPGLREEAKRNQEASAALAQEKSTSGPAGRIHFAAPSDAQHYTRLDTEAVRLNLDLSKLESESTAAEGRRSRIANVLPELEDLTHGLIAHSIASTPLRLLGLDYSDETIGERIAGEWASKLVGHGRRLDEAFDSALSDFVAVDDGLENPPRRPGAWGELQKTASEHLRAHVARRSSVRAFEQDVEHYLHLKADLQLLGDVQPVTQTLNELQKTFDRAYDLGRTKLNALSSGRSGANAFYISCVALIIAVMSLTVEACSMTAAMQSTPEPSGSVVQTAPEPPTQVVPEPTSPPAAMSPVDTTLTDSVRNARAPRSSDTVATAPTQRDGARP